MIRLNNTPNEGSTVKVNLGFRDSAGQYYIPAKITYTFLALNDDKESWSVVDNLYEVALTPASSVTLTIPDVKTITGTTLSRKVMVYWDAFVDGEYNSFVDEITFDIAPKPYIPNPPALQPQPQIYVEINSISLQIGTLTATPLQPVFLLKLNLPVKIDDAMARIITVSGDYIDCAISSNTVGSDITITPNSALDYQSTYTLRLAGLVSSINNYQMKEPFVCNFATQSRDMPHEPVIEDSKSVELISNGTHVVSPDTDYDAMKEVEVTVNVTPTMQQKIANENGEVTADSGFDGLSKVIVDVHPPLQVKTVSENGVVEPDSSYYGLSKVTVDIPPVLIESRKTETITENGTTLITPSTGYDAMGEVEVTVDTPTPKPEQTKSVTINENGAMTVEPDEGKVLTSVDITVDIPLEINKTETINISSYADPVEITPTAGKDAMKKVTVTLTNMTRMYVWKDPSGNPNPHYMYTTYSNVSESDGHAYQCGTTKNALLTRKNVEVNGEALYVSGYPSSLYYRDPNNDIQF